MTAERPLEVGLAARRRRWRLALGGAALAALMSATLVPARIFSRSSAGLSAEQLLHALGARLAFSCEVEINGAPGELSVLQARGDVQDVADAWRRRHGDALAGLGLGAQMARGTVERNGSVQRLLAIDAPAAGGCLIVIIDQTADDYRRSLRPPAARMLTELPEVPDSRPEFFVRDRRTRFALEVSTSRSDAASTDTELDAALTAQGWHALTPGRGADAATPALRLYARGRATCAAFVQSSAGGGAGSTITLLHKLPGEE